MTPAVEMIDVDDEMIQAVIDLWENVGGPAFPPPPPPKDRVLPSSKRSPCSSLPVQRQSSGHPLRPQHSAPLLRVGPSRFGAPLPRQAEFGSALPASKAAKALGTDFPSAEDASSRSPTSPSSSSSGKWSGSSMTSFSSSYDPTLDAVALHESFLALNSKRPSPALLNKTIMALSRRPEVIPLVKHRFKTLYSHDLTTILRTSTSGNHRLLIMRLLAGPSRYDAEWLTAYCRHPNLPADDKIVAETLFGKPPAELERLKATFSALNGGQKLRDALAKRYGPAPSAFGRAAVRILSGYRGAGEEAALPPGGLEREAAILAHVEDLYRSADRTGNKYLDQGLLVELVLRRSDAYLRGLCKRFAERHARELVDVVAARERVLVGSAGVLPNNLVCTLPLLATRALLTRRKRHTPSSTH